MGSHDGLVLIGNDGQDAHLQDGQGVGNQKLQIDNVEGRQR